MQSKFADFMHLDYFNTEVFALVYALLVVALVMQEAATTWTMHLTVDKVRTLEACGPLANSSVGDSPSFALSVGRPGMLLGLIPINSKDNIFQALWHVLLATSAALPFLQALDTARQNYYSSTSFLPKSLQLSLQFANSLLMSFDLLFKCCNSTLEGVCSLLPTIKHCHSYVATSHVHIQVKNHPLIYQNTCPNTCSYFANSTLHSIKPNLIVSLRQHTCNTVS
jgi:hypothetical protein